METDDNGPKRSKKKPRKPVSADNDKIIAIVKKKKEGVYPMIDFMVAKKMAAKKITSAFVSKKSKIETKKPTKTTAIEKKPNTKIPRKMPSGQKKSKNSPN